jgi:hypothetical protein
MNKKKEVSTAFKMWEHMAELQSILWDLYYDDFLDLIIEQQKEKPSKDDTSDIKYPF